MERDGIQWVVRLWKQQSARGVVYIAISDSTRRQVSIQAHACLEPSGVKKHTHVHAPTRTRERTYRHASSSIVRVPA